jgi:hypothetical protein
MSPQLVVDISDPADRAEGRRILQLVEAGDIEATRPEPGSQGSADDSPHDFLDDWQGLSSSEWIRLLDSLWVRMGSSLRRTQKAKAAYPSASDDPSGAFWTSEQLAHDLKIPVQKLIGRQGSMGRSLAAGGRECRIDNDDLRLDLFEDLGGQGRGPWQYRLAEPARDYFAKK